MDFRFEVRDAQNLLGILADEEIIQPTRIATTGNSYGAGMSMSLAALKDRVMDLDGTLHPWKSPGGKDMEIAVAAPLAPGPISVPRWPPTATPSTRSRMRGTSGRPA
ncbi:MAG: hypothetical protein ACSLFI_09140 [Solirubrobacterales bacterium]